MKINKKLVIGLGVLAFFILLSLVPYSFNTKNTAFPNDIQIERQLFPNIEEIGSSITGTTKIPSTVDLSKVYQLKFISKACSSNIKILKDGVSIGLIQFPSCESQFYSEKESAPFQHYPEKVLTIETNGINGNFNYVFEVTETSPLSFEKEGIMYSTSKNDFSYKIELYEKVTCTRSSHCPEVNIDGVDYTSFCSAQHKCSIDSKDLKLDTTQTDEREIVPINNGIPIWVSILGAFIISGIVIFFIFRFMGGKR